MLYSRFPCSGPSFQHLQSNIWRAKTELQRSSFDYTYPKCNFAMSEKMERKRMHILVRWKLSCQNQKQVWEKERVRVWGSHFFWNTSVMKHLESKRGFEILGSFRSAQVEYSSYQGWKSKPWIVNMIIKSHKCTVRCVEIIILTKHALQPINVLSYISYLYFMIHFK